MEKSTTHIQVREGDDLKQLIVDSEDISTEEADKEIMSTYKREESSG